MAEWRAEVAIIGAGPSGLAAALALKSAGVEDIIVLERETEPGGVPRHCGHPPFGMREFGRVLTGPAYARRLVERARSAGIEIARRHSVVALKPGGTLKVATPSGPVDLTAARILLATGVRETPRSARLVGGERGLGVMTTGSLQAMVYLEGLVPFRHPVIVGTELVSFSAILTAREAGMRPVAMVESGSRTTARWPAGLLPRLLGIPVHYRTRLVAIKGTARVDSVLLERDVGKQFTVDCDGVLFTGGFVPAAELVRMSHLQLDAMSGGPAIDQYGRTSDPAVFATGNLLRPVETAGWSFREGRRIGALIAEDLKGRLPASGRTVDVACRRGIKFAVPQRLAMPVNGIGLPALQLRVEAPMSGELLVETEGRPIWRRSISTRPERRLLIPLAELPVPGDATAIEVGFKYEGEEERR